MALDVETEELTCDTEGCDATENLTASVPAGWYFTVEDVKNHVATHTDYCPEHANGRRRKTTDPMPGETA